MVDFYPNAAQQDFEQLPERIGRTKVLQQNPRTRTDQYKAAVAQLYGEVSAASCVNLFSGGEHVAALRGTGSLPAVRD
jgi:hypothetical protein